MKIVHTIVKVLFSLLLVMPILGSFGVFPPPTRDLYTTDLAFAYIQILMEVGYVNFVMAIVMLLAVIAVWTKREALAALLLLPLTVNVVGFHAFVDGGLFSTGAILANAMLVFNVYFLWKNREQYHSLLKW